MPLVDPGGLQPLELADGPRASLDRRVRTCQWLTEQATAHKVRIRDLARQLFPTLNDAVNGELRGADLAVLERYGDPRALLAAGHQRIAEELRAGSVGHLAAAKVQVRARAWVGVAQAAVELYGDAGAMPYADVAAELASEVRLLRAVWAEQQPHQQARERAYLQVEPDELARSLPGIAEVGAPLRVAAMGRPQRFGSAAKFKAFTGLTPRASETGETDRKGPGDHKAGAVLGRADQRPAVRAARRRRAPGQHRGGQADHRGASAVPEEVRRRRRSTKPRGGKAPQHVRSGHAQPGTRDAEPGRPSLRRSSTPPVARSTR